jgi:imidazolonepropionase-like amidohydrolase
LHATVIDGTGSVPLRDAAIIMSSGRILAMGPAAKVKTPAGAQVIDLTGKTIIPGIINAHSHISDDPAVKLRHYAQYGITSTIGMGGDGDDVLKIRDDQRHGDIKGARAYTVQQRFEFEKDAPTPDIARLKVEELYKKGADAVKVVVDNRRNTQVKLRPEITAAIIDQAHKHHMKAFAHIHDYDDAKVLMEQGIDMLAHQVRDREVDDAFIAMMKAKTVGITSTLVRELSSFVYADSPAWLNDPFLIRFSDPTRIQIAKTQLRDQQSKLPDLALNRRDLEIAAKNFTKMVNAGGVRIALGTDSGPVPTRFEGFFEHLEMELMVKYGMTPMQVIQAFSKTNSEILGIDKDYGTLAKGKMADLVVLDKNPLDDILNTRTVNAVYIGGKKFE